MQGIAQKVFADPDRYTIPQLMSAIQNEVIPAYIGMPVLHAKIEEEKKRIKFRPSPDQSSPPQTSIKEELMQQAMQSEGVPSLPSNLPVRMAGGGIVAFDGGGKVERYNNAGLIGPVNPNETPYDRLNRLRLEQVAYEENLAKTPEGRAQLAARDRATLGNIGLNLARPVAAAGDVLIGGPVNALANVNDYVVNALGAPRAARALGMVGPEYGEAKSSFRIGSGSATPFYDMIRAREAGGSATAPTTPASGAPTPATPNKPLARFERPSLLGAPVPGGGGGGGGAGIGFSKLPGFVPAKLEAAPQATDYASMISTFDEKGVVDRAAEQAKKLNEEYAPMFEAREKRLSAREERIRSAEEKAPYLAAIKGFLKIAQTRGPLGSAIAAGGEEGLVDLARAKVANDAARDKAEELRDAHDAFKVNLQAGNRREAMQNLMQMESLRKQSEQARMQAAQATDSFKANIWSTQTNAALQQAGQENQFAIGLEGIKTQRAGIGAQAAASQRQYELLKQRFDVAQQQAQAGNTRAQAQLAEVSRKMALDFQQSVLPRLQTEIKDLPRTEQQIRINRAWQEYSSRAAPIQFGQMSGLGDGGISSLFGGTRSARDADSLLGMD